MRKELDHIQSDTDQCFYSVLQDDLIITAFLGLYEQLSIFLMT